MRTASNDRAIAGNSPAGGLHGHETVVRQFEAGCFRPDDFAAAGPEIIRKRGHEGQRVDRMAILGKRKADIRLVGQRGFELTQFLTA